MKLSAASLVLGVLSKFLSSADPTLSLAHVKRPPQTDDSYPATAVVDSDHEDDTVLSNLTGSDVDNNDDQTGGNGGGNDREEGVTNAGMTSSPPPRPSSDGTEKPSPPPPPPVKDRSGHPPLDQATVLDWANTCWTAMQAVGKPQRGGGGGGGGEEDGERDEEGALGMTHAGYLKLFQLSRPCLSRTYDVIMLDEAQDSNPCIASIVLRETACARILVGDSHQVIMYV